MKRFLSLVLCLTMCLSLCPVSFAEDIPDAEIIDEQVDILSEPVEILAEPVDEFPVEEAVAENIPAEEPDVQSDVSAQSDAFEAMLPMSAKAAGDSEPQIIVSDVTAKPGEQVTLYVSLANNPGIAGLCVKIEYDSDVLENVTVACVPDVIPGSWTIEKKAVWCAPSPEQGEDPNQYYNGNILSVTATVKDNAELGTYPVTVSYNPGDICDFNMNDVDFTPVAGNVTVVNSFTVSYDANEGENAPESQTKNPGEDLYLSTQAPTREGYEFLGWATSAGATEAEYQPGDKYTADADLELFAVWAEEAPVTYTVTYYANEGNNAPEPQVKNHGEELTLTSDEPDRAGFDFLGWAKDAQAAVPEFKGGDTYNEDADLALYAVWVDSSLTYGLFKTFLWTLDADYTLTVSGIGDMPSFASSAAPWSNYLSMIKTVVINSGVTSVGKSAFYNATALTKVVICEGVETLENKSFSKTGITTLMLPASLTNIMSYAFNASSKLTAIGYVGTEEDWDGKVTVGANNAPVSKDKIVWNAKEAYTVSFDLNGVEGTLAPQIKPFGETIVLNSPEPVEDSEFLGWAAAKEADSPDYQPGAYFTVNADTLLYAVWGTPKQYFVKNESIVGTNLKWSLDEDYTLTVNGIGKIPNYDASDAPWVNYKNQIITVVINTGVTAVGKNAFYQCKALTRVELAEGVTRIYNKAFSASSVSTIILPTSLTTVDNYAFNGCSSLNTILYAGTASDWSTKVSVGTNNAPLTVTENFVWGYKPFYTVSFDANGGEGSFDPQTKPFGEAIYLTKTSPTNGASSFRGWATDKLAAAPEYKPGARFTIDADTVLYAVWGSYTATGTIDGTNLSWTLDEDGVLVISGTGAIPSFEGKTAPWAEYKTDIINVVIKPGVTAVGREAFYQYKALTRAELPEGVLRIEKKAFSACTALTTVILPSSLATVADYAFNGSSKLKTIGYAGSESDWNKVSVATAHNAPLVNKANFVWNYKEFYTVSFDPNGGTGRIASMSKPFGETIMLTTAVPSYDDFAFDGWATTAEASEAEYQPGDSFSVNADTTLFAVWKSYLDYGSIAGTGLRWALDYDGTLTVSGSGAIPNYDKTAAPWSADTGKITTVIIGSGVSSVGKSAFYKCTALTLVDIAEGLKRIDNKAFSACTALTTVILPASLTTVVTYAFNGSSKLNLVGYTGTESAWAKISIGASGNTSLANANKSFGISRYYTVSYDVNGGEGQFAPQTKAFGRTIALSSVIPTLEGFEFLGWATSAEATKAEYFAGSGFSTNADTELHAVWGTPKQYVVYNQAFADSFTWSLETNGTLTVNGNGALPNYDKTKAPWNEYLSQIKTVIINSGITSIGKNTFYKYTALTRVEIGESVKTIDNKAFSACTALKTVFLPVSLKNVVSYAFNGSKNLETVYYAGTEADWGKVTVGSNNTVLTTDKFVWNTKP